MDAVGRDHGVGAGAGAVGKAQGNAVARMRGSSPMPRSTRMAFGLIWIPAPSRTKRGACSKIRAAMPR